MQFLYRAFLAFLNNMSRVKQLTLGPFPVTCYQSNDFYVFVIVTLKQARTYIYMLEKTEAKTMYCFPLCFPQQSFIEFKNVSRLPTCCSKCTIKTINHITLFRLQKQQHIQFNDIHMHQS